MSTQPALGYARATYPSIPAGTQPQRMWTATLPTESSKLILAVTGSTEKRPATRLATLNSPRCQDTP